MKNLILALCAIILSNAAIGRELSVFTASKLQQAQKYDSKGQLEKAIGVLQPLTISRSYDRAMVDRSLGVYFWKNNQLKLSAHHLQKALETDAIEGKQQTELRKMLADVLFNQREFREALQHYAQLTAVTQEPTRSQLWLSMAKAHYQLEQWQQTIDAANRVVGASKHNFEPLTIKLSAQIHSSQWRGAEKTLRALLKYQPKNPNWWRQLVNVELHSGDTRGALTALSLAKNQIALNVQDRKLLARLFDKSGIPERAALELSLLPTSEQNIDLLVEQAGYWQKAKEWEHAAIVWESLSKKDEKYHRQLALALTQNGDHQKALNVLERYQVKRADIALLKAKVHDKLNQLDEALEEAKAAQKIEPSASAESWIEYLSNKKMVSNKLKQQARYQKEGRNTSAL